MNPITIFMLFNPKFYIESVFGWLKPKAGGEDGVDKANKVDKYSLSN